MTDPAPPPDGISRRRFLSRASLLALAGFAVAAGARETATRALAGARGASPAPSGAPDPQATTGMRTCTVIECEGCACGGDYYKCTGCNKTTKACYTGHKCKTFTMSC